MLRRISDMPTGTIGFEAIGEVEDDDWEEAVEPVLRRDIADAQNIRLLYLLGPEARVEGEAMTAGAGFRALRNVLRSRGRSQRRGLDPSRSARALVPPSRESQGLSRARLGAAKAWLAEEDNG
jgi:hypothetical protein